mgnify:FL=1
MRSFSERVSIAPHLQNARPEFVPERVGVFPSPPPRPTHDDGGGLACEIFFLGLGNVLYCSVWVSSVGVGGGKCVYRYLAASLESGACGEGGEWGERERGCMYLYLPFWGIAKSSGTDTD